MIIDKLQMVRPFPLRVEFGAEVRMCRVSPAQKIQNGLGTQVGQYRSYHEKPGVDESAA